MYNKKNQATNPQGGRVARSQREERYGQIPSAVPNNSFNSTDVCTNVWSAERCFYILSLINYHVDNYNEFVLEYDPNTKFKKPLPHFKTLSDFVVWIIDTNPKAVKEFVVGLFTTFGKNGLYSIGESIPDQLLCYEEYKYYEAFAKYLKERVHLLSHDDEEE